MIRLLKGNKDSVTNSRTRAINQIKAILVTAPALLREQLEPMANINLIATCAAFRIAVVDCPFAAAKKGIAELLEDLDQLTQQACPGLRKTYGIAVDGALMLPTASRSQRLGPLYVV